MADARDEASPPPAALGASTALPLPPPPPSPPAPPVDAGAASPGSPYMPLAAIDLPDGASTAEPATVAEMFQLDVDTPGSQALLETLFPSGSEGGSPPPLRRRPTRSPSREPAQLDGSVVAEGSSGAGLHGGREQAVVNGQPSNFSSPGPPSPSAESSLPAEAISSLAGPSSHEPALPPASQQQRNASPGPSRPSPLPPATSKTSAVVPPEPAAAAAVPRLNLPVVSFRIVERPPRPPTSAVAQSYGYNASGPNGGPPLFVQPIHLMRSVDPIESDLMDQVEYDMDPQDYAWVETVNASYRKGPNDPVPNVLSDEFFTIALDRIEKEWWELTKRIPNPRSQMPSEEEACAICDDADGENSNAIVFCDGCNLAVHQGEDLLSPPSSLCALPFALTSSLFRLSRPHRLLRRALHPGGPVALPQVHRLA
jgi:hypothetical protein